MEKYFCNYNQSLALKELGYDPFMREDCLAYFNTSNSNHDLETKDWWCLPENDFQYALSAPLKSQVFEWARNEHKIHCSYGTTSDSREKVNGYCINNFIDGNRNYLHINWEVGTYEEAESACIDKLIEIVKNK